MIVSRIRLAFWLYVAVRIAMFAAAFWFVVRYAWM